MRIRVYLKLYVAIQKVLLLDIYLAMI